MTSQSPAKLTQAWFEANDEVQGLLGDGRIPGFARAWWGTVYRSLKEPGLDDLLRIIDRLKAARERFEAEVPASVA